MMKKLISNFFQIHELLSSVYLDISLIQVNIVLFLKKILFIQEG